MRAIELRSRDGRYSAYMTGRGRLLMAGGRFDQDAYPPQLSPPFERTGICCRACYRELTDMPQVLRLLADRLKRKRLHASYHRRCLARKRRSR